MRYDSFELEEALEQLGKRDREALAGIAEKAARKDLPGVLDGLRDYAVTRSRQGRKARLDAQRDRKARVLVGARVSRERAELVKQAAQWSGRSTYRLVMDALEKEVQDTLGFVSF